MIWPSELRIGNKVKQAFATLTVLSVGIENCKCTDHNRTSVCSCANIDPIILSDKLLEKWGFEPCNDDGLWWHKENNSLTLQNRYLNEDGYNAEINKWDIPPVISNLHELQNLYYSLMGEELKQIQ